MAEGKMWRIRPETPTDTANVHDLIRSAFLDAEHASGFEASIVDCLRESGALTLSLLAVDDDEIVGHVAFSPVSIGGQSGWFGLGPVAVRRDRRKQRVGERLIAEGLASLKAQGAGGCVVLGNPAYYGRFGFACDPKVVLAGVPPRYFQRLRFRGEQPSGFVAYHPAFDVG
jgi:putative acetyltransferase